MGLFSKIKDVVSDVVDSVVDFGLDEGLPFVADYIVPGSGQFVAAAQDGKDIISGGGGQTTITGSSGGSSAQSGFSAFFVRGGIVLTGIVLVLIGGFILAQRQK